jgi:hypothetical protein
MKALMANAAGTRISLFLSEPRHTAQTTGNSRSARTPATCWAFSARSSPSTPAVFCAATLVSAATSSSTLAMSSMSKSRLAPAISGFILSCAVVATIQRELTDPVGPSIYRRTTLAQNLAFPGIKGRRRNEYVAAPVSATLTLGRLQEIGLRVICHGRFLTGTGFGCRLCHATIHTYAANAVKITPPMVAAVNRKFRPNFNNACLTSFVGRTMVQQNSRHSFEAGCTAETVLHISFRQFH